MARNLVQQLVLKEFANLNLFDAHDIGKLLTDMLNAYNIIEARRGDPEQFPDPNIGLAGQPDNRPTSDALIGQQIKEYLSKAPLIPLSPGN